MKYRPLLLRQPHADEMVRAFLDGRKTQFRVPVKPQPRVVHGIHPDSSITTNRIFRKGDQRIHSPFGTIGDRLWVRETWMIARKQNKELAFGWVADHVWSKDRIVKCPHNWSERDLPSIHMPRWASRIDLEITAVRVERVQDITEEDAKAEGCEMDGDFPKQKPHKSGIGLVGWDSPAEWFSDVWDSIYGTWDASPLVFAYTVKRIKP